MNTRYGRSDWTLNQVARRSRQNVFAHFPRNLPFCARRKKEWFIIVTHHRSYQRAGRKIFLPFDMMVGVTGLEPAQPSRKMRARCVARRLAPAAPHFSACFVCKTPPCGILRTKPLGPELVRDNQKSRWSGTDRSSKKRTGEHCSPVLFCEK